MCGFIGYFSKKYKIINHSKIKKILHHRGPDDFKVYEGRNKLFHFMSFNRLSIIDLNKRSSQPFKFKNFIITFNGEIYNYKILKKNLIEKFGAKFLTNSDTEVIIQHIYYTGIKDTLNNIEGMWSFALFDINKEKLILCRDYFGEKPLYYKNDRGKMIYGSELSIFKHLSPDKLKINYKYIEKYLFNEYRALNSNDELIYKDIKLLEPGTYLEIDAKLKVKKHKYYKINDENKKIDYRKFIKTIKFKLIKNINNCLNSDRPLALTLSGGVDSTGIASIIKKKFKKNIKAFTIFSGDKNFDEFQQVKKTVKLLKLKHKWVNINKNDFIKNLNKIIIKRHNPLPTLTSYIQWLMYQEISKENYKVVLSGNGADEIYSGYYDHYLAQLNDLKKNDFNKKFSEWKKNISPLIRNPKFKDIKYYANNYKKILIGENLSKKFGIKKYKIKLKDDKKFKYLLKNRMYNELRYESLPIILMEEDMNAMFFSIENRSPYLNHKIVKKIQEIHPRYLIRNGYNKVILRDMLTNLAPKHIIKNFEKIGFNISLNKIINLNSKSVKNFINKKSNIFNIVNKKKLLNLLKNNDEINKYQSFLFKFLNAKIFLDRMEQK